MTERDHYSLLEYGWMINDLARTAPFVEALRAAVRPESVVVDIGTGIGLFAILAARYGARRVYAIEPDDSIEVGRLCAKDNADSDRIIWIQGMSTEVELPERADVIIADLHGNLPFHADHLRSMIDARRRLLKPGGTMIPAKDVLRAAPVESPDDDRNYASPWSTNVYDVRFDAGVRFVRNTISRARADALPDHAFLADPAEWGTIDFATIDSPDLSASLDWRVSRSGTLHGFYVWFDCTVGGELGFSNSPTRAALPYGRSFFPIERATEVAVGDSIESRMSATQVSSAPVFRWQTRITDQAGRTKGDFAQTSFNDRPIDIGRLRRVAADHVPRLNAEGAADALVLDGFARSMPLHDIARALSREFPERFADYARALNRVCALAAKYSDA